MPKGRCGVQDSDASPGSVDTDGTVDELGGESPDQARVRASMAGFGSDESVRGHGLFGGQEPGHPSPIHLVQAPLGVPDLPRSVAQSPPMSMQASESQSRAWPSMDVPTDNVLSNLRADAGPPKLRVGPLEPRGSHDATFDPGPAGPRVIRLIPAPHRWLGRPQLLILQGDVADTRARGGEDGIEHGRGRDRDGRFANAPPEPAGGHEDRLHLRHLGHQ